MPGMRHISDILPGVFEYLLSSSCCMGSDLDNRYNDRRGTQDVGYFTQERGRDAQGYAGSVGDV
ncbi:hypothetical protein [Kozakia baliensis]|uniref:hypothetical protein n=1 Tax=Kozakia baliensis TaxID=153496 RepID=UPI0011758C43|nr:hypothetical protein [Kozakia baliensis]GBR25525.1 hypothetical protein AA0488_0670 [Kozakia baliensis NRIC 0488]GEL64013.1 hypothetical protein KBA01_12990 [Kozakia baliensis]